MKFHIRIFGLALAVALMALTPAAADAKKPNRNVVIALGDSLSVGVQPDSTGQNQNTGQGFATQLAKSVGGVKLVNYGCGAATSGTFIQGKRPCGPARNPGYKNTSAKTSQLAQAEKYLKANRDRVRYVTLDIGNNDLASCGKGGMIDVPCLQKGIAEVKKNLPVIIKGLRKAAGPKVPIVGATFYDPFLQSYFASPAIAQASVDLAKKQVNNQLVASYKKGKVRVADVATAFGTYIPFSQTTSYGNRSDIPVAVANICKYTWMCAPSPRGPNIHANKTGYKVMADTFRKALPASAR